jgi:two-component system chemotaxis response regulator CheB
MNAVDTETVWRVGTMAGRASRKSTTTTTTVALVGSAGGLAAISRVLSALPDDLDAAVIVVMHLLPDRPSTLPDVLRRHTGLRVKAAETDDAVEPGWVYVAPPDAHLLLGADGRLRLDAGPPVHHVRPAADTLLDSLAAFGDGSSLAVILSGSGSDGASGAAAVKAAGGRVVVQDPATSEHAGMPAAAVATGSADSVVPLAEIAQAIRSFVAERRSA